MKEFKLNNNTYRLDNSYSSKSDGFVHASSLYINDNYVGTSHVRYLNRTWEQYDYQTSMKKAVQSAIDNNHEHKNELEILYTQL